VTPHSSGHQYHERPETDGELLPVVDANDQVIGLESRRQIHLRGLLHRAVHVVITNTQGQIVLQKRSERKDNLPGWWDVSVGGHVGPDETYLAAAIREIGEEMGLSGTLPRWIGQLAPAVETGWEFIHVFALETNAPVRPDPSEISDIQWLTPAEYLRRSDHQGPDWRVSPAGDQSIRLFLGTQRPD
jgi:isopentenyldiphosphate isomerase